MKFALLGLALLAQTSLASHPRYASAVNPTADGTPPPPFPEPFWPVPSSPHTFTPRWRQVKRATPRSANPPPPRGNFRGGGMGMGGGMGGYGGGMMGGGYGGGMMGGVGTTEP